MVTRKEKRETQDKLYNDYLNLADRMLKRILDMKGQKGGMAWDDMEVDPEYRKSYTILETPPEFPEGVKAGDVLRSFEMYVPEYSYPALVVEKADFRYGTTEVVISMNLGCISSMDCCTDSCKISSAWDAIWQSFDSTQAKLADRGVRALMFFQQLALEHQERQQVQWEKFGKKWLNCKGEIE